MGELHLEIIVDRMKREFSVEANVGAPQVAYRETIRETVEQEGKFVRQSGGRGQYGHVWLRIEPRESGSGYEFVNEIVGGVVPKEYIPAVDKGVQEQMELATGSVGEVSSGRFSIRRAPLVVANILAPVLVNLLEQGLSYLLTNQGILILSGILEEQTIDVEAAIEASGLRLEEKRQIADWVALVVKKLG